MVATYRPRRLKGVSPIVLAAAYFCWFPSANATPIVNGSFESPLFPSSSTCGPYNDCVGYNVGDDIGGWFVVGEGGAPGASVVLLLDGNYDEPDNSGNNATLNFHPEDGTRALDVTGEGNQGVTNGVKQSITSTPGHLYEISFYVGNQFDDALGYSGPSSIGFYINGLLVDTYSNPENTPEDVNWRQFTFDFTAPTNLTTFAFLNSTPLGDNFAGLDDVSLSDLTSIPEPASIGVFAIGLLAAAAARKRKLPRYVWRARVGAQEG